MARRFVDAFSVMVLVMLRKSIVVYRELAFMAMNVFSVITSLARFGGLFYGRGDAFSGRRSHRSSMFLRYDG